jgi:hypothetical protein
MIVADTLHHNALAADASSSTTAVDLTAHQHGTHTNTGYKAFDARCVLASGSGTAVVFKITSVAKHLAVTLTTSKLFLSTCYYFQSITRLKLHGHSRDTIIHN